MDNVFFSEEDTIAAIATPAGQAGIGIIRISGSLAPDIASRIFRPKKPVKEFESHRLYLGNLVNPATGDAIDEVMLCHMKAPHSYTREHVIEINSHSGYLLLSTILQIIMDQGARIARPGEFTFRAFLNGRIDLTQAEAVTNLINSRSERGLQLASRQVQGAFKEKIQTLRQAVVDVLAQVEVAIDFSEEEAGVLPVEAMLQKLETRVIQPIDALIQARAGNIWFDGINTVITGRVNAGKSSLINRLSNDEKAIVTPIPGTTRDVIGSTVTIKDVPFHFLDTAGIRHVNDEVEQIGIQLAEKKLSEADLVLIVIDQSRPLNQDDMAILKKATGKKALVVNNKIDLPSKLDTTTPFDNFPVVRISALTGEGMDQLTDMLVETVLDPGADLTVDSVIPNLRHTRALTDAATFFANAVQALKKNVPTEILAVELKSGLDALGEIIGETTSEDILDSIFSQFCLGK